MLSPRLPGARFLDLFAGSGANGLEAVSRGAARAVLVDNDRKSLTAIRMNVARTGLSGDIQCIQATLPEEMARVGRPFDIVFADPPYAFAQYEALLQVLSDRAILTGDGMVCIEHARKTTLPETVGAVRRIRERLYGHTALSIYI